MKAKPIRHLSEAEYLEGEKRSEVRHEYIDGVVYAMTGASKRHNGIVGAMYRALYASARRKHCQVFFEAVKLQVQARRSYYYPDVIVSCQPEPDEFFVSQPCAVFEVESRETALTDRREKRQAYTTLDSLQEYVILSQDVVAATVYRRSDDGTGWIEEQLGPGDPLRIACVDLSLLLDSLYDDL